MCGSGTIAIEAAMLMKGIAPGRSRKFAAEEFSFISKRVWDDAREEAFDTEKKTDFQAFASDVDSNAVALAEKNARLAGVSDCVKVFRQDARRISADGRRGSIVTNPPYGERLGTLREAEQLYKEIGVHFRSLSPWQVYIITSHAGFEKFYGKRADKVRKLYNGMLPCYLYQYFKNN
jgi:putative N6-adenine-specific DNA methylase